MAQHDFFGFIIVDFHEGPDIWHVELANERVTYVGELTITLHRTYDRNPVTMFTLSAYVELHMPFSDIWNATVCRTPPERSTVSSARTLKWRQAHRTSVLGPSHHNGFIDNDPPM